MSMAEKVILESVRVRPLACPGIGCAKRLILAKIVTKRIKRCMKGATTAEWWTVNGGYITAVRRVRVENFEKAVVRS